MSLRIASLTTVQSGTKPKHLLAVHCNKWSLQIRMSLLTVLLLFFNIAFTVYSVEIVLCYASYIFVMLLRPLLCFLHPLLVFFRPLLCFIHPLICFVHPLLCFLHPLLCFLRPLLCFIRPLLCFLHFCYASYILCYASYSLCYAPSPLLCFNRFKLLSVLFLLFNFSYFLFCVFFDPCIVSPYVCYRYLPFAPL